MKYKSQKTIKIILLKEFLLKCQIKTQRTDSQMKILKNLEKERIKHLLQIAQEEQYQQTTERQSETVYGQITKK